MPSRTISIPVNPPYAHIGAAAYLAVVAYPSHSEVPKRDAFIYAIKALLLKRWIRHGGDRKRVRPEFRIRPNQQINKRIHAAFSRIFTRRLPAAKVYEQFVLAEAGPLIARAFLMDIEKRFGPLPRTVKTQIAKRGLPASRGRVESQLHSHRDENFRRLVWRESLPVLHLCVALAERVADMREAAGSTDLMDLIVDPSWLVTAIERAEQLRRVLVALSPQESSKSGGLGGLWVEEGISIQLVTEKS